MHEWHAISFADFDRDGDQDILEVLAGSFSGDTYMSVLLENPGHGNHWLGLKLKGVWLGPVAMRLQKFAFRQGEEVHRH